MFLLSPLGFVESSTLYWHPIMKEKSLGTDHVPTKSLRTLVSRVPCSVNLSNFLGGSNSSITFPKMAGFGQLSSACWNLQTQLVLGREMPRGMGI